MITKGYRLPAKWVIHTVGPIWQGGDAGEDELLASCYRSCFRYVQPYGIRSIAFPSISTGAYRFPVERASRIALREIEAYLRQDKSLEKVVVVCFNASVYEAYQQSLKEMDEMEKGGV
jgi:O-acetyl-ADP-ribose deacetylase (regulator of RNase III)